MHEGDWLRPSMHLMFGSRPQGRSNVDTFERLELMVRGPTIRLRGNPTAGADDRLIHLLYLPGQVQ